MKTKRFFGFMKRRERGAPSRAFTVVELLVVIAVIALGAAMLLPALAKTRPNSRLFQCMNNQRQLTAAWLMYAGDCNDLCCSNVSSSPFGPSYTAWVTGIMSWDWGLPAGANTNVQYLLGSALGAYTKTTDVYKCPADIYTSTIGPRLRSVSMNWYIGDYTGASIAYGGLGYRIYNKLTDFTVPGPAKTFVFVDECPDSINDGLLQVNMSSSLWVDVPSSLHNGGCGFSFADGHVENHKWVDSNTRHPVIRGMCQGAGAPAFNDLAWLKARASALK